MSVRYLRGQANKLRRKIEDDPYSEWYAHDDYDNDVPIYRVLEEIMDGAEVLVHRNEVYRLTTGVTVVCDS